MARTCIQMTATELTAYLAANPTHTLVSGPHDTQEECEAVCASTTGTGTDLGGDGEAIVTECCPEGLPAQLTVTVVTTDCNVSVPALWNATQSAYVADLSSCACIGGEVKLVCQSGSWYRDVSSWYLTGALNATGVMESCDPLQITFNITRCGGGTIVVTV